MANPPNVQRALEIGLTVLPKLGFAAIEDAHRANVPHVKRLAAEALRPDKPQLPCDVGLFSDEADQLDLVSLFRE